MTSSEKMKELIELQVKFYNERNLEGFCSCFHSEIEVSRLGIEEVKVGMDLFKEGYKKMFESSPNLFCEIKSRIYLKGAVVDEEFVTGSSLYPDGIHVVAVYRFKDNLISNVCFIR